MSQIKNQQNSLNEALENQLGALPDCYDYLSNVIEPKFRNKFRKEDVTIDFDLRASTYAFLTTSASPT